MKKNTIYYSILFLVLLLSGCDNDKSVAPQEEIPPVLLSTNPQNGVTLLPTTSSIVLEFDKNIVFINKTNFTLNREYLSDITVSKKTITIPLVDLEENTKYILRVRDLTIRAEPGVFYNDSIQLEFTTSEYPIAQNPVVANPSPEVRKLYKYLYDNYKSKTISAMMADVAWNNTESERVYQVTGKYPAINSYDYIHLAWSPANWIDYDDLTPVKTWWDAGGIVAAGWHWNVPKEEGETDPGNLTYSAEETSFKTGNATVDGTWENEIVKADLAKIAGYLTLLQQEGIPVLWRPLHEAAGNIYEYSGGKAWFWWGNDGADAYKKLWIYMFNYFQAEGLDNLIWVWTSQTKDAAFYPGDQYVDIIGRDLYNMDADECAEQYKILQRAYNNKIVTLSECGSVGLISEQWSAGARWSWFMPWYDNEGAEETHASDEWWIDAMNQTFVVTRDQLPSFK